MPKSDLTFDADYAPVADRISEFYATHPNGRIITRLVSRTDDEIIFKALVYRSPDERRPAATGWASERPGDGDVNAVACLENTETSAIGRALANLGFTASRNRPSREEMEKAARERMRLAGAARVAERATFDDVYGSGAVLRSQSLARRADAASDVLSLLQVATRNGLREKRANAMRARVTQRDVTGETLRRTGKLLRRWIARRTAESVGSGRESARRGARATADQPDVTSPRLHQ